MKRINWDRFEKVEYSTRRAALANPESKIGKEMLFLVDTVQLLRLQVKSLQERLKSKGGGVKFAIGVEYPITAIVEENTVLGVIGNE